MSWTLSVRGSAANSSHVSSTSFSTSPKTRNVQVARSVRGTVPAWRTGHFSVRYCPGGRRAVSNDVTADETCEALLLTPKARVIAPLVVWRRGDDDFLLLTEPELGEIVRAHLTRMRFAAKCEIAREEHV